MKLHQYIKSLRMEKSLMSFEIAEKLGISRDDYMRIESGEVLPSLFQFRKLEKMLGMDEAVYIKIFKEELIRRNNTIKIENKES